MPKGRFWKHSLALAISFCLVFASFALSQRRKARNIPKDGTIVEWTLFVSPRGEHPAERRPIPNTAGEIDVPGLGYRCRYSEPNRVAATSTAWSETRMLECEIGGVLVSTNGFCQVFEKSWGPRAAVLYIGAGPLADRVQISLDCLVRPP
ncbi:MAG: hypothetical protein NZM37_07645 [Sandaracinaceae bacterium]|nr:hypothetical protein [Sandaracinaceae bacterium]